MKYGFFKNNMSVIGSDNYSFYKLTQLIMFVYHYNSYIFDITTIFHTVYKHYLLVPIMTYKMNDQSDVTSIYFQT